MADYSQPVGQSGYNVPDSGSPESRHSIESIKLSENCAVPSTEKSNLETKRSGLEKFASGAKWVVGMVARLILALIALPLMLGFMACFIAKGVISAVASLIGLIPYLGSHFLEPIIGKIGSALCGIGAFVCYYGMQVIVRPDLLFSKEGREELKKDFPLIKEIATYQTWVESRPPARPHPKMVV